MKVALHSGKTLKRETAMFFKCWMMVVEIGHPSSSMKWSQRLIILPLCMSCRVGDMKRGTKFRLVGEPVSPTCVQMVGMYQHETVDNIRTTFNNKDLEVLTWPSYSTDLNLIEHLGSHFDGWFQTAVWCTTVSMTPDINNKLPGPCSATPSMYGC